MNAAEPVQQSFVSWAMAALGPLYLSLLPLSALLSFLLVIVLLLRGKGAMAVASVLLLIHLPLMIGVFAAIQGLIGSFAVIAASSNAPKPSEVAAGFSTALFAPTFAMLLMAPTYVVAALGTFVRALSPGSASVPSQ